MLDEHQLRRLREELGFGRVEAVERAREGIDEHPDYCYIRPDAEEGFEYRREEESFVSRYVVVAGSSDGDSFDLLRRLLRACDRAALYVTAASRRSEAIYEEETGLKPRRRVTLAMVRVEIRMGLDCLQC